MPRIRDIRAYLVFRMAMWVILLLQFKVRCEDLIPSAVNDVVVSVPTPKNSCLLVLVHNGAQLICAEDKDEVYVLRSSDLRLHHDLAYFVQPRDSNRILLSGRLQVNKSMDQPTRLSIIWPKKNTVITSSNFDVHVFGVVQIPDVETLLCVQADSAQFLYCVPSVNTSIISVSLPEGKHTLAVYQTEAPFQEPVTIAQEAYRSIDIEIFLRTKQKEAFVGAPHVFIPQQFSDWMLFAEKRGDEPMHILLMSARSLDRYEEAEVFLKSMFFHMREGNHLVIHLLVDEGGYMFFRGVFNTYDFSTRFPNVAIVMHDYSAVCIKGTDNFLAKFSSPQSPHHSGKAGYCRLFITRYFTELSAELTGDSLVYKDIFIPKKLAILETDQILLADISDLWKQFDLFTESQVIAAAENYQPWQDSRPFENEFHQDYGGKVSVGDDNAYHGYGIIGGVFLFDLVHMNEIDWDHYIETAYAKFISNRSGWYPMLNDQDVLNAALSVDDGMKFLRVLPCEWNVQLHARINSIIACMEPINNDSVSVKRTFEEIPLNCPESRRKGIFVCTKRSKILHFMAQSYKAFVDVYTSYYGGFWQGFEQLSWTNL